MEKERRTKALVVVVLLIVVAGLTVAFAALSATLNINGTAYLDAAKWGIRFENLSSPTKIGSATTTGTAKIEETKAAEITGINVSLSTPGDKVVYTVDLVNKGTINAKIDNIEKTVLTSEQQRYLTFKVTDQNGKEVSEGDILSAGETKNLTITIEFIKDLTKEDLPKQTSTTSLSYKLNFVQTDDKAVTTKNLKSTIVNGTKGSGTFLNGTITKDSVESISFLSNNEVPTNVIGSWDASQEKDKTVMAWYIDNDKNGLYEVYIGGQGKVIAPENMSYFFDSFSKLQTLDLNFLDTSNVTNMTTMFYRDGALTNLTLKDFVTPNVKDMSFMFYKCLSLTDINLSNFDTTNVTNMKSMFFMCSKLTKIDLSGFNTKNVTDMSYMFAYCEKIKSYDFSKFNTINVNTMEYMFHKNFDLTKLNLSNFNTKNVTNMNAMFSQCTSLESLNVSSFNTSNVENIQSLFYHCTSLINLDLSNWNVSKVTSLYSTFDMCSSLKSLNLNNWNTTKITSIRTAFYGCSSLSELDLSSFDFSNVTDYTENSFYNVTVPIYVKNDKSKEFLLSKNSSLNVIVK